MTSNSKSSLKNSFVNNQPPTEDKNDFLQKSNDSLGKSNLSNEVASPKGNIKEKDDIEDGDRNEANDGNEEDHHRGQEENQQEQGEQHEHNQLNHSEDHVEQKQHQQENQQLQSNQDYAITSPKPTHSPKSSHLKDIHQSPAPTQLQSLLTKFQHQLSTLQSSPSHSTPQSQRQISQLQTNIFILQIKLRLKQKLKNRHQLISLQRINHLELIFKHYCTHIFKTGKHMTFDRLEYEKVHLTIDRLSVFLKDFNLTTIKMKDNKVREIIEKQEIIKLFKKISPNCRDLDFQQFILILQRLGQLYFDSKITYQQRKINQRKQRLKIKQILEKKEKYKQEMLKKHQQKMQKLQKGINDTNDDVREKVQTEGGENDELIEKMINQGTEEVQQNKQSRISKQAKNISHHKKSASLYSKTFKRDMDAQMDQNNQKNSLRTLSKQQKIQYFYQIINVDDIQSFSNKMRQLNLPMFKIYAGKQQKSKKQSTKQQRQDQHIPSNIQGTKIQTDDQKRLKELREKLNERNQKIKQSSVPSLNKEEYQLRKLKRSRLQEQAEGPSIKIQRKPKKIDLTQGEINLSSLSKLAYQNVNFSKFNPKKFYKKEQDDDIFLQQYGDSPVRARKPQAKTQLSKVSQNSTRIMDAQEKNTDNLLQKLKQRQSQLQINQKKEQVSQMYRFNDRTQRQKRLIDKFLEKSSK